MNENTHTSTAAHLLALLLISFVSAGDASADDDLRIVWSPSDLELTLDAGGRSERTFTLQLFGDDDVDEPIKLVVSDTLHPFVTVNPQDISEGIFDDDDEFDRVLQVTVTIEVPIDTSPASFEGEIALRAEEDDDDDSDSDSDDGDDSRSLPNSLPITLSIRQPVSIEISTTPFKNLLPVGQSDSILTAISLPIGGASSSTVALTQSITARSGPSSGLSVSPDISGEFPIADLAEPFVQQISGVTDGVYEVTTTAEVVDSGQSASSVAIVRVLSRLRNLTLALPGSIPGALAPNNLTPVVFTAKVQGSDNLDEVDVLIDGDLALALNDAGLDGDIAALDGTFSGTASIDSTGMDAGSCLSFFATATQGSKTATSDVEELCVTSFPLNIAPSDISNSVLDPSGGGPIVADEVLIVTIPGTPETEIAQIASSVDGTVAGQIAGLDTYQIKLSAPKTDGAELAALIADLETLPQINSADVNAIFQIAAVSPNDTLFSFSDLTQQFGLKKIRSQEAWSIARGRGTIAIVDSGADLDHPDLIGKIVQNFGRDFVDPGTNPEDGCGHGTLVAGVAAAETDNNIGIAGVSWDSQILVVRVANDQCRSQTNAGAWAMVADGITYAANHARFINVSLSFDDRRAARRVLCPAVARAALSNARAKGSLVIAAAGNQAGSAKRYPAACPDAFSVGATTTESDLIWDETNNPEGSNFGSWVDIAAPGTQILSTAQRGTCGAPLCFPPEPSILPGYTDFTIKGTSVSAPMVAGAAAVLFSADTALSNDEINLRLSQTAKKLPRNRANGGFDTRLGRLNLFAAVCDTDAADNSVFFAVPPLQPGGPTSIQALEIPPVGNAILDISTAATAVQPGNIVGRPEGLAFDDDGNLYYGDSTFNPNVVTLMKVPKGTSTPVQARTVIDASAGSRIFSSFQIRYDHESKSLYFPHPEIRRNDGTVARPATIERIDVATNTQSTFVASSAIAGNPEGLAFDDSGNLYFGDATFGPNIVTLMKVPRGTTTPQRVKTVIDSSAGSRVFGTFQIRYDRNSDALYFPHPEVRRSDGTVAIPESIQKLDLRSNSQSTFVDSAHIAGRSGGLAFDPIGNLYFGDTTFNPLTITLKKLPAGETIPRQLGTVLSTNGGALAFAAFHVASQCDAK